MKLGILGSGMVGKALGGKLVELGHEVVMGTREAAKLSEWLAEVGGGARAGTFAEAASHGEIIFNATNGSGALEALQLAGEANLNGKILVDISNPLDFSKGMPPSLFVCNTDSLGEQIQRAFPNVKVVKSLNTLTAPLMVNPQLVGNGEHTIFVSGNDADAKATVVNFLKREFGWRDVLDLGDIKTARGVEMVLPLWINLYGHLGTGMLQFRVVR
jgi:hypothetical protein